MKRKLSCMSQKSTFDLECGIAAPIFEENEEGLL